MPSGGKRPGAGRKQGASTKRTRAIADGLIEAGVTPLEVMLRAMRQHYAEERWDAAAAIAKDCAPYLHPRLSSVEHKRSPIDLERLSDDELDFLERLVERGDAGGTEDGEAPPAGTAGPGDRRTRH